MKKYFLIFIGLTFSFLAYAGEADKEFFGILQRVINFLFWALMIATIFLVLYAAYQFLLSDGDPDKVSKAKKNILYGVIAIVLAFLAVGSANIIIELMGADSSPDGIYFDTGDFW